VEICLGAPLLILCTNIQFCEIVGFFLQMQTLYIKQPNYRKVLERG
jgi:hypothetical protein